MNDVRTWSESLLAAALVGTARRDVPALLPGLGAMPAQAGREQRLLGSAALADVLVRGGARSGGPGEPVLAPPDDLPVAGPRAEQLLELLLTQPPMGRAHQRDLVGRWLHLAVSTGRRVPPRLLPVLLASPHVPAQAREDLRTAVGERGRWLAGLAPHLAIGRATAAGEPTASDPRPLPEDWHHGWGQLPTKQALEVLRRAREADPDAARAVLEQHWPTLGAKGRAEMLQALGTGLGPDDEAFLESVLDNRSVSVRRRAAGLLAELPGSALSARMGERLRELLSVHGTLRRRMEIAVVDDPGPPAVRDGLTAPGAKVTVTQRADWLRAIVAAAPLSVWSDVARRDAAGTVALLAHDGPVLAMLVEPVVRAGDVAWASALFAAGVREPGVISLLPARDRREWAIAALRTRPFPREAAHFLETTPHPWDEEVASTVLAAFTAKDGAVLAPLLTPLLPTGVPPSLYAQVRALVDRGAGDPERHRALVDVVQFHAFLTSLTEAFQ